MEKYDLCIIGGGPSGYAAAMRAIDFGKKVVLIERDKIGGTGLYNGALSSKAMWEFSQKYFTVKNELKESGADGFDISFEDFMKTTNAAVFDRKFQLAVHVKLLQTETEKKVFTYERGNAVLKNKNEVVIQKVEKEKTIYADYIILATGSRPRKLPTIPIDEKIIFTSDGIFSITDFPKSMVVLGAGVIGCEFATIFSNLGKTKVFLIDKADRILPFEDEDVSSTAASNLEKNGAVIHRNSSLARMEIKNGEVEYELQYKDGRKEIHHVEKALVSVGRIPNTDNLGLENAGVQVDPNGYIVEKDTQTTVPTIYAVGDISRNVALVNVGELEGRLAVEKIFSEPDKKLNYQNLSAIMFLNPEVATVGLNEQQAKEKKLNFRVVKIDYSCIARAIAMRKTQGFFKIIVTDDDEMKILGMRAVGEHASSAIQAVALLISMDKGIGVLADLIHPHPSIIEGIQECVRMLMGKSIFKSSVFKDKLKCYRYVNGEIIPMERL
ncbi:MAG: NAD(P)/FAD-dependent oxidoreductase [Bacteroidetes bacterium]|nr:NAD(P)/FAD-dependent oxidoreductase [Bacteroidota bacterium]